MNIVQKLKQHPVVLAAVIVVVILAALVHHASASPVEEVSVTDTDAAAGALHTLDTTTTEVTLPADAAGSVVPVTETTPVVPVTTPVAPVVAPVTATK